MAKGRGNGYTTTAWHPGGLRSRKWPLIEIIWWEDGSITVKVPDRIVDRSSIESIRRFTDGSTEVDFKKADKKDRVHVPA